MSDSKAYTRTYEGSSSDGSPPIQVYPSSLPTGSIHRDMVEELLKIQSYRQPLMVSNVMEPPFNKIGNPGPLGLFSFAITTFVYGVYLTGAGYTDFNPRSTNAIFGLAFFMGGLAQFVAGMWEFRVGNTFGATVHSSYGAFWMSYTVLLVPSFQIEASYDGDLRAYSFAIGIYATLWAFLTFIFILAALKTNFAMLSTFVFLCLTFLFDGLVSFTTTTNSTSSLRLSKVTGTFALISSLSAFYAGSAGIMSPERTFVKIPLGAIGTKIVEDAENEDGSPDDR